MREPGLRIRGRIAVWCAAIALTACGSTTDTVGQGDPAKAPPDQPLQNTSLTPLSGHGPDAYPTPFHDLLMKSNEEASALFDTTFERLFHGEPVNEAIYFTAATDPDDDGLGPDEALIKDIYHGGDIRTEGIGLG